MQRFRIAGPLNKGVFGGILTADRYRCRTAAVRYFFEDEDLPRFEAAGSITERCRYQGDVSDIHTRSFVPVRTADYPDRCFRTEFALQVLGGVQFKDNAMKAFKPFAHYWRSGHAREGQQYNDDHPQSTRRDRERTRTAWRASSRRHAIRLNKGRLRATSSIQPIKCDGGVTTMHAQRCSYQIKHGTQ